MADVSETDEAEGGEELETTRSDTSLMHPGSPRGEGAAGVAAQERASDALFEIELLLEDEQDLVYDPAPEDYQVGGE